MAILNDGEGLTLQIRYKDFRHGWVSYDVICCWQGEPIFNDAVLKRRNEYWGSRAPGSMLVNDIDTCVILPFLDNVICTRKADYLTLLDPDMTIAVWPNDYFPFLPSKWESVSLSDAYAAQLQREADERQKAGGVRDDDAVQVIVAFDSNQFANSDCYTGTGPALHIMPRWGEFKRFAAELRAEYALFDAQHGISAALEAKRKQYRDEEDKGDPLPGD